MKTIQIKNGNRDWWQITIELLEETTDEDGHPDFVYGLMLSKQKDSTGTWNPIYSTTLPTIIIMAKIIQICWYLIFCLNIKQKLMQM